MEVIFFLLDTVGWFAWVFFLGALGLGLFFAREQWGMSALRREHAVLQERLLRLRWIQEQSRGFVPRALPPLMLTAREPATVAVRPQQEERDLEEERRIFAPPSHLTLPRRRDLSEVREAQFEPRPGEVTPSSPPRVSTAGGAERSARVEQPVLEMAAEVIKEPAELKLLPSEVKSAPLEVVMDLSMKVPGPPTTSLVLTPRPAPAPSVQTIRILLPPADEPEEDFEPEHPDALWMIRGIGPRTERALNAMGVYRFVQIASWSPDSVKRYQDQLQTELPLVRIQRDRWVEQALELDELSHALNGRFVPKPGVDHESVILTDFAGEHVTEDPALGIVFEDQPELVDPLSRIDGIGPVKEEQLHQAGIYRFLQIATWSADNLAAVAAKIGVNRQWILDHHWIPQARLLQWQTYMASPEWGEIPPTLADLEEKIRMDYRGEPVKADLARGILFSKRPDQVDEFLQIRGLTRGLTAQLQAAGVWQYRQIADWSEAQVRAFAKLLEIDRLRIYQQGWVSQARQLAILSRKRAAFAGESIRLDQRLGILYYAPPDDPDPLTEIEGIDPETASFLNRYGIHKFKQIAQWETEQVREFIRLSGLPLSKVLRGRWPAQAQELHQARHGFAA